MTPDDRLKFVYRSKLVSEKKLCVKKTMREDLTMEFGRINMNLRSLYVDGSKDRTLVQEDCGHKLHCRTVHDLDKLIEEILTIQLLNSLAFHAIPNSLEICQDSCS